MIDTSLPIEVHNKCIRAMGSPTIRDMRQSIRDAKEILRIKNEMAQIEYQIQQINNLLKDQHGR